MKVGRDMLFVKRGVFGPMHVGSKMMGAMIAVIKGPPIDPTSGHAARMVVGVGWITSVVLNHIDSDNPPHAIELW